MIEGDLRRIREYYGSKLAEHGPSPQGVDWKDGRSQELRFAQLVKVLEGRGRATLNDFGCGYGAFYGYLRKLPGWKGVEYRGVDISPAMIDSARETFGAGMGRFSVAGSSSLRKADYTVASGVFNVKLTVSRKKWEAYVLRSLDALWRISRRGLAFNILSAYADKPKMRKGLYYADPLFYFNYCKKKFSKHVSLLHDYGHYEFTMLVRRGP